MKNLIDERIAKASEVLAGIYKKHYWQWTNSEDNYFVPGPAHIALQLRELYDSVADKGIGHSAGTGRLHIVKTETDFEIHLEIIDD